MAALNPRYLRVGSQYIQPVDMQSIVDGVVNPKTKELFLQGDVSPDPRLEPSFFPTRHEHTSSLGQCLDLVLPRVSPVLITTALFPRRRRDEVKTIRTHAPNQSEEDDVLDRTLYSLCPLWTVISAANGKGGHEHQQRGIRAYRSMEVTGLTNQFVVSLFLGFMRVPTITLLARAIVMIVGRSTEGPERTVELLTTRKPESVLPDIIRYGNMGKCVFQPVTGDESSRATREMVKTVEGSGGSHLAQRLMFPWKHSFTFFLGGEVDPWYEIRQKESYGSIDDVAKYKRHAFHSVESDGVRTVLATCPKIYQNDIPLLAVTSCLLDKTYNDGQAKRLAVPMSLIFVDRVGRQKQYIVKCTANCRGGTDLVSLSLCSTHLAVIPTSFYSQTLPVLLSQPWSLSSPDIAGKIPVGPNPAILTPGRASPRGGDMPVSNRSVSDSRVGRHPPRVAVGPSLLQSSKTKITTLCHHGGFKRVALPW
ncbi:hypothetical protein HD554DRAFT_2035257 [Boletus coccyginus]|nr:hypothetical protein HD554DRAFT_2035257 [Boletus coccyginus]